MEYFYDAETKTERFSKTVMSLYKQTLFYEVGEPSADDFSEARMELIGRLAKAAFTMPLEDLETAMRFVDGLDRSKDSRPMKVITMDYNSVLSLMDGTRSYIDDAIGEGTVIKLPGFVVGVTALREGGYGIEGHIIGMAPELANHLRMEALVPKPGMTLTHSSNCAATTIVAVDRSRTATVSFDRAGRFFSPAHELVKLMVMLDGSDDEDV